MLTVGTACAAISGVSDCLVSLEAGIRATTAIVRTFLTASDTLSTILLAFQMPQYALEEIAEFVLDTQSRQYKCTHEVYGTARLGHPFQVLRLSLLMTRAYQHLNSI